jgi:hypothetical protein
MATYRLPFDDDGAWQGGANWDDPAGGHPLSQAYAFDFGHPVGGNVRAARSGWVADVENLDGNTGLDPHAWKIVPNMRGEGTTIWIRHMDGTVAAYCHLKYQSTKVVKGQYVLQGEIIALSNHTGNSSSPHLHFDLRINWNSRDNFGPTVPVQFEDKNHVSWRPKSGDPLASNNSILRQEEWRWCSRCHGLYFGGKPSMGTTGGKCPAGGTHAQGMGAQNYILVVNSNVPGQADWRWCHKCQGLFFAGNPGSRCPATGEHDKTGSGNITLVNSPNAPGQAGWRWCSKCQGLFLPGSGSKCPATGEHDNERTKIENRVNSLKAELATAQKNLQQQKGSDFWVQKVKDLLQQLLNEEKLLELATSNYTLVTMGPGEPQADWRWCHKCQGLFFAGNPGSKCPVGVGEAHDGTGSSNYVLVYDYTPPNAPGQADWRWCHKCQGLFFAGNPGSRCPAGEAHDKTGSGNITLVMNLPNAPGQADWRLCHKCQGLFLAGNPGSKCPAGGAHDKTNSANYTLPEQKIA